MKTACHESKAVTVHALAGVFLFFLITAKAQVVHNPWEGKYYQREATLADENPSAEDMKWEAGYRGSTILTVTANDGLIEGGYGLPGNFRFKHLDRVKIKVSKPDDEMLQSREGFALQTWYVPVAWGVRKYLIHTNDLLAFCNAVNEGEEPRKSRFGNFLMQENGETKDVTGWPEVPLDHRKYLLKQPVEAIITKVGKLEETKGSPYPKTVEIQLNQGSKAGLIEGMEFRFSQRTREELLEGVEYHALEWHPFMRGTVKSLTLESAVAEVQMMAGVKRLPEVGMKLFALGPQQHPWSGDYYSAAGSSELLSRRFLLTLAPNFGITRRTYGPYGVYDASNHDHAEVRVSRLTLALMLSRSSYGKDKNHLPDVRMSYLPVAWGERRYLLAPSQMIRFCEVVKIGQEPRVSRHGEFLMRDGDENKKVTGWPEVPLEYEKYLLKKPVEASISKVGELTDGDRDQLRKADVELDRGSEAGIFEGMEFYYVDRVGYYGMIRVKKVAENSAEAVAECYGEQGIVPKIGMKLSTRPPWIKP